MPEMVTITIDGQKVSVPKGSLVIEAASQIGIDVPRFCYHPKLSAVGMCRMCLGEVGMPKMNPDKTPALNEDGTPAIAMMPKPQTLCTTTAAEGMVVLSETPAVVKMREGVLEFFLANHPLDCPICDKGGECMLQDQSMVYAKGDSRVQDMYHLRKDLDKNHHLSELITLDRERCIQCARCTRFQDEVAQDSVLALVQRGSKTMIDTLSDPPFDSKFSGNTIDLCPVGALTSRDFRFRARVWELTNVPTVSMIDGSGTNIFVSQRNETLVRVIPRDNESINECWISDRDRYGLDYIDSDARLTQPLVRREGKLVPATWDEALQLVADKLKTAAPEKVAAVGGPKLINEGALAMAKLFRDVVKTPNLDSDWTPKAATPGSPSPAFYDELEAADVILVVGTNPNEELPILDLRLKKAAFQRKAHLITIGTAKTALDRLAKQSFLINEGTEVALANGLAKGVHQSWTAEPQQTERLGAIQAEDGAVFVESLSEYSSTRVAELCGLDEAAVRAAAEAIAKSERLFVLVGENAAPATLAALNNLAKLKDRESALVVLRGEPNAVGVRRMGLGQDGRNGGKIVEAAAKGQIDVLYLAATNPLNGAADGSLARRALENTPFVVVQSLFENEVTAHAHVVLPAASFLEQDGTAANFHGLTQNLKQVFRPRERRDADGDTLSACAPDWIIFTKLAQLLGTDWGYRASADIIKETRALTALPDIQTRYVAVPYAASAESVPEGALRIISSPLLYDGGESFTYLERLSKVLPAPFAHLNRADAKKLGLDNNCLVEIKTKNGSAKVRLKVGRQIKEGTVWIPRRLGELRANNLIDASAAFTAATLTKLEDAPVKAAADSHAAGVGQGIPLPMAH